MKQLAPRVTRAAVIRDPSVPGGIGQFGALQGSAPLFGMELIPVDVRDKDEIERTLTIAGQRTNTGLIVTANTLASIQRQLIISLAVRTRLPAVYASRIFVTDGGLISYGAVTSDNYRRAAGYVDRILRGEKPANLPVQAPTNYELVLNLKTAKTLGIDIPPTVRARADEVVE